MKHLKIIFIFLLILASSSVVVKAEESKEYHTGYNKIDYQLEKSTSSKSQKIARSKTHFQDCYDPRKIGMVSSIKNQNETDTCWAYSVIAMAESNLIKQGIVDQDIDLSEHHLTYFLYNTSQDPLGNTVGDKATLNNSFNYLNAGGNYYLAFQFLSGYSGLVNESVVSSMPDSALKPETIDAKYQYDYNSYTLKNAYYIDEYEINTIKEFVETYGAVGISYEYSNDSKTMNFEHNAIYNSKGHVQNANHSVTIVGWDDHYDKNNFTTMPECDGAWLIKNSWGNVGSEDGYFWMSYEEPSITDIVAAEFEKATYDHNYHYDGNVSVGYYPFENEVSYANVYQVKGNQTGNDELLKAISTTVGTTDTQYSIEIYKNVKYGESPTSGTLATVEPIIGKTTYAGNYTIELQEPITLAQGDYYSIVVMLKKENDDVGLMLEFAQKANWIALEAAREENQSFYYNGEDWKDLYDASYTARIKGLTINTQSKSLFKINMPKSKILTVGDTYQLVTTPTSKSISWQTSDSNIVSVDDNGNVEAKSVGQATITATTEYGSKTICYITVNEKEVEKVNHEENPIKIQLDNDKKLESHKNKENDIQTNQIINTSDESQIGIWIGVICIALIGVAILMKKRK